TVLHDVDANGTRNPDAAPLPAIDLELRRKPLNRAQVMCCRECGALILVGLDDDFHALLGQARDVDRERDRAFRLLAHALPASSPASGKTIRPASSSSSGCVASSSEDRST